jgi:hypothetical protein
MSLYGELADRFRRQINSGELAPGYRFPVQPDLAEELGVSLGTVHRLMRVLKLEGVIYTTHDGTYVGPRPPGPRAPVQPTPAPAPKKPRKPRPWVSAEEAARELAEYGYEPDAPYPGRAGASWRVRCLGCGERRGIMLSVLRATGVRCKHTRSQALTHAEASRELAGYGFRPYEKYPGTASQVWRVLCKTCGQPRRASLARLRCGRRCRHQGWKGER